MPREDGVDLIRKWSGSEKIDPMIRRYSSPAALCFLLRTTLALEEEGKTAVQEAAKWAKSKTRVFNFSAAYKSAFSHQHSSSLYTKMRRSTQVIKTLLKEVGGVSELWVILDVCSEKWLCEMEEVSKILGVYFNGWFPTKKNGSWFFSTYIMTTKWEVPVYTA